MKRFILELRRREVFRTTGLYVGICWILIEASSVLLPTFDAPEWIMRWIVIAAVIGFPVMLVLAWIYDVSDDGIEIQPDAAGTVVIPLGSRKMDFVVIGVLTVALLFSVYLNITGEAEYVAPPDPVAVLIADFENQTGDTLFDGSLEQAFQIGLEIAPFITAYARTDAQDIAVEIRPGSVLDAEVARLVSVRENIGMVLAGRIVPDGRGYELTITALEPQLGEVIAMADAGASNKSEVLSAVGQLASELMEELGGEALDTEVVFSGDSFTATSLEAVKSYTTAQELQHQRRDDEAIEFYAKAVEQDPNFTRAYSGWALSAFNLGRIEQSDALWEKALANLERVTERERLRTLGLYYSVVTRNYAKALESYEELVEKFPADDIGLNNLAVLRFYSLDFDAALAAGRNLLDIYSGSAMYQTNYALFAMYASDFEKAVTEARAALEQDPAYYSAWLPIAIKALVDGDIDAARGAYESMGSASEQGAPIAGVGLGDSALYTGEFEKGREQLRQAIELANAQENRYVAATAQMAIAFAYEAEGDLVTALAAAENALELQDGEPWVVQAGLLHIEAGDTERAGRIAADLERELQPQSRAYGRLLEGLIAHSNGEPVRAIDTLSGALKLADLWLIRFYLGQVYLEAGYFAEAIDEFTKCMERRGEAASLFLDDIPTFRYVVAVYYWLGRAEEGLGMIQPAKDKYRRFIDLRPNGGALVEDASARL